MDHRTRQRLQAELQARPSGQTTRLVIHAAAPAHGAGAPSPDQFESRTAYRKALIDHETGADTASLERLVERLRSMGLDTSVSRPSQTVVVEGRPEALSRALEDADVEDADLDREIEVIRPVAPGDADR